MTLIKAPDKKPFSDFSASRNENPFKPSIYEVLEVENTGASKRGSTFWKSLLACPREHALTHEARLQPRYVGDPLTLGWAWHHVLETYYRGLQASPPVAEIADAYAVINTLIEHPDYQAFGTKLNAMFDAYLDTYEPFDKWRIVAVEENLEYSGMFDYSARLDLVVEDQDRGGLWIVEHKSARLLSAELLDNYQLDMQILGQVWLMRHCVDASQYPQFKGVRINITTTGTKTPQCARTEVYPSDAHLAAFERSMRGLVELRKTAAKQLWPQYLGHCAGYSRGYGRCGFFDVCHNFPEISVNAWKTADLPPTYARR